jgi:diacylglycerol kinase family enzyme
MKTYAIICNPKSGTAAPPEELVIAFNAHGVDAKILDVAAGINALVEQVHAMSPYVLVASGGDGTVNTVANVAAQTGRVMAVLPTGTFNHFCKDIKVPAILDEAISIAVDGEVQNLDYATVNGYAFVNSSSIGAYPEAILTRENLRDSLTKMTAMAVAIVKTAQANETMRITITANGKSQTLDTPSVFIGNNLYDLEGVGVPVRNRLQDGLLGVYILEAGSIGDLLAAGLFAFAGKQHDKIISFTTKTNLILESDQKSTELSLDGEVAKFDFPLEYQIHPKALKVMVPKSRKDGFDLE